MTIGHRHRYLIVLLVISLPFLALLALNLQASRLHARSAAIGRVEDLSLVLETHLRLQFSAAEQVVSLMAHHVPPQAMQRSQVQRYRPQVAAWLQTHINALAHHSMLRYFDAEGRSLYASVATEAEDSIADQAHFHQLKEHPEDTLLYSDTRAHPASGHVFFDIVHAVRDEQKRFLGVATVTIDVGSLHEELKGLQLGPDSIVTLRRVNNGALVVSYPGAVVADNSPSTDLAISPAIRQGDREGILDVASPLDGVRRMYGYRAIGHTPIYVAVGLAENDYIAEDNRLGRASMALGVVFLFILITALFLMNRASRARDRSEEKLRASELRFRRLVDQHHAVILQIEPQTGSIFDANAAATRFYGWSHTELCRMSIRDINCLPPEDVGAALKRSQSGECTHFIFPHRLSSGEIRTVDVHATPIEVEDRVLLVAIIFDITQRIRNEEEIKRLMQEQKAILDGQLIGIAKLHQRHILWGNQAFARMFGYATEALVGMPARAFYAEEADFAHFGLKAYPAIQNGGCHRDTLRLQRRNGSIGWFDVNIAPLFPGSDIAIMAFVDVTERMTSQLALQESEERFRTLADYTYDMETWLGPEGQLIYISPACERVSGYAPAEYKADPELLDRIVLEEDRERVAAACRLGPDDAPCDLSFRIRCKSGELRWIARGIRPVRSRDGRPLGLRANDRDITELKHAEQLAQSLAYADPLTGLPNRRMLMERLTQSLLRAQRFHRALGLIFIDLNHFKQVNDQWGHETGDELLRQVAERLRSCIRACDTVARIGGDEFVILLTELNQPENATRVADKILHIFVEPVQLGEHRLTVTMSMGITLPNPDHAQDAREVMAQADRAMYSVKRSGRNGWTLFEGTAPV
jgi:diguanylate cyclase (GGDEF)-like protein/PAS domain S-box-containing protein